MKTSRRSLIIALAGVALPAACASGPAQPVREFLDTGTGVTVTSSRAPIVLYRDTAATAAYARKLVHLGPIEVNRSGDYRYFLWLGIWNTLQPTDAVEQRDGFDSIVILVDGEPLMLELAGWTPSTIGASVPVYPKPVASAADAYYPVTVDQIRFMAEAADLRLRTTGAAPAEYELWDGPRQARRSLRSFLEAVGY
jgi:hypothetical protein